MIRVETYQKWFESNSVLIKEKMMAWDNDIEVGSRSLSEKALCVANRELEEVAKVVGLQLIDTDRGRAEVHAGPLTLFNGKGYGEINHSFFIDSCGNILDISFGQLLWQDLALNAGERIWAVMDLVPEMVQVKNGIAVLIGSRRDILVDLGIEYRVEY